MLIRSSTTDLKKAEISIAFTELGNLFGKYQKEPTAAFQMFAPFDNEKNILFQVRFNYKSSIVSTKLYRLIMSYSPPTPQTKLTLRLLMPYIYMEHPFLMFLDHKRCSTVGRTPLDE